MLLPQLQQSVVYYEIIMRTWSLEMYRNQADVRCLWLASPPRQKLERAAIKGLDGWGFNSIELLKQVDKFSTKFFSCLEQDFAKSLVYLNSNQTLGAWHEMRTDDLVVSRFHEARPLTLKLAPVVRRLYEFCVRWYDTRTGVMGSCPGAVKFPLQPPLHCAEWACSFCD